jgi:hypothetical protein
MDSMDSDPKLPSSDCEHPSNVSGDCGCGCGGTGGCGEAKSATTHAAREGRRKFLVGGIGVGAFAATFASRPAFAACQNLTGLYSPTGSHQSGVCAASGKTPGFWANHATGWPATISPSDTFSKWFGSFTFTASTETIKKALCPPNGSDNLAFQIAAGLLNAESPHTKGGFGYGSAKAFADAVILAMKALSYEAPSYPHIQSRIGLMNSDNSTLGAWSSQQSVCS